MILSDRHKTNYLQMNNYLINWYKILLLSVFQLMLLSLNANPLSMEIDQGWRFRQARLNNWYPATVPGVVHTDLLNNKLIEDPYFRLNERGLQWIDKEDWVYETTFDVPDDMFAKNNILLRFKGLDDYADVYLNDVKILEADNMFREWTADAKALIKKAGNRLKVYFHSPIRVDMPKWEALPFHYQAINDQSENGGLFDRKLSVFARKAGYQYGWDWGPRLVTSGIWRPVLLEAWDDARIADVAFIQNDVTAKQACITTSVEVLSDKDISGVVIGVKDGHSGKTYGTATVDLKKGNNTFTVPFVIRNPKLWWCNGLGNPDMYDFQTGLSLKGATIDSKASRIGVRSLKLITKPDSVGSTFYFELNGVPVFAKGANYVPCDNFLPRVTSQIYEKTILDAVNANMNMLRVWGGGTYENDIFYDLCDKYGILVWQDFMFACSLYPAEGHWLENVRREAVDNVKRLRNHACIAIWCGNNECYEAWIGWGWNKQYEQQNPEYAAIIGRQYTDLYDKVLPGVVHQYAPTAFYWPSSPFSKQGTTSSPYTGDNHYWSVWHGREPIEKYNVVRSRFFSEYGFQSFPEFESVKKYAPGKEDWNIYSDVMMAHQRGGSFANGLIESYLLSEYQKPKDFEAFLYMNQVLQGDAIKTAIEAHRRDRPYCMGTLFWQHNDCWPVASWSSRDYYGRWKAQHYFAREAYRDVLVSPIAQNDRLHVFVVSDRRSGFRATLTIQVIGLDGGIINTVTKQVTVDKLASTDLFSVPVGDLLQGMPKSKVVVHAELSEGGKNVYSNNYFLLKQKEMEYPKVQIAKTIKKVEGGYEVSLTSDKFARALFLSVNGIDNFFADNYMDILPGATVTVFVKTPLDRESFGKQLKWITLSDAY
jgi:beta-mannosidase